MRIVLIKIVRFLEDGLEPPLTYDEANKRLLLLLSYIQDYDLENGVKVTQNFTCLTLSQRYIHSSLMNIHPFVQKISHFSNKSNFCQLGLVTLKMRSRSPKYSKLFRLVGIKTKMQEIYHFSTIFTYLSSSVALKIRSRSPNSNQL